MSAAWREDSRETPLQWCARLPLVPLAWLTAGAAALHRTAYERSWFEARRLACPVISVGALQAGGSGKTPTAAALARLLVESRRAEPAARDASGSAVDPAVHGAGDPAGDRAVRSAGGQAVGTALDPATGRRRRAVALASRGYGRRSAGRGRDVVCVSNGREILADLESAGDEPLLLASEAPGAAVWVARDRGRAGEAALRAQPLDALVLDDGFQHHRLARDIDLVCVDARAGLGRACLPRGTRREGLRALLRADALIVIDGPLAERDRVRLERHAPAAARFEAFRRVRGLRPLSARAEADRASSAAVLPEGLRSAVDLVGREVGLLSGIARPRAFRATVEGLGARVVAERQFPDHHHFGAADFRGEWLAGAPVWLTTAKDAVKLRRPWLRGTPVVVVDLELAFAQPRALLDWLDARVSAALARRAGAPTD